MAEKKRRVRRKRQVKAKVESLPAVAEPEIPAPIAAVVETQPKPELKPFISGRWLILGLGLFFTLAGIGVAGYGTIIRNAGLGMASLMAGLILGLPLIYFGYSRHTVIKANIRSKQGDIACLNYYPREMGGVKGEFLSPEKIHKGADIWEIEGKRVYAQVWDGKGFVPMRQSAVVLFPPDRAARIPGCLPYQRLKSLSYSLLEKLAPFAPVVALVIGALLYIIVIG